MDGNVAVTLSHPSVWLGLVALVVGCRAPVPVSEFELSDRWVRADTQHIRLETDLGARRGEELAWAIEDLYLALLRVFPRCTLNRAPRVEATVFARRADFREVAPPNAAGIMTWPRPDGLVHTNMRVVLAYDQRARIAQILAHELTHQLIGLCMPTAPTWLHEGLASYFETLRVHDDRIVVGTSPFRLRALDGGYFVADGLLFREVGIGTLPRVGALLQLEPDGFYGDAPDSSTPRYAAAWLLVHYLMLGPDRGMRARFTSFLEELQQPVPATDLFFHSFAGTGIDDLVADYARQRTRLARTVRYAPVEIRPTVVPMGAAEVHTRWAELLVRGEEGYEAALQHLELVDTNRGLLLRAMMAAGAERRALVEAAALRSPRDLDVLYARARLALNEPDSAEAGEIVATLGEREDLRSYDRVVLGELLRRRGDRPAALSLALYAHVEAPNDWQALELIGHTMLELGRASESVEPLYTAWVLTAERNAEAATRIHALLQEARLRTATAAAEEPVP